jgi:MSHA pilin protein MshA
MSRNKGFTLIELVIVIVILGILAATAAPRFMDIQKDARISSIQGLHGAVRSAVNMVYSKALIQGTDRIALYNGESNDSVSDISICSNTKDIVCTIYGNPAPHFDGIKRALQHDNDFHITDFREPCSIPDGWCVYDDSENGSIYFAPASSAGIQGTVAQGNTQSSIDDTKSCGLKYQVTIDGTQSTVKTAVLEGGC